ncbi:MAG: hypothetical protein AB7P20_16255 [Rhizobiaceae bacterium]
MLSIPGVAPIDRAAGFGKLSHPTSSSAMKVGSCRRLPPKNLIYLVSTCDNRREKQAASKPAIEMCRAAFHRFLECLTTMTGQATGGQITFFPPKSALPKGSRWLKKVNCHKHLPFDAGHAS